MTVTKNGKTPRICTSLFYRTIYISSIHLEKTMNIYTPYMYTYQTKQQHHPWHPSFSDHPHFKSSSIHHLSIIKYILILSYIILVHIFKFIPYIPFQAPKKPARHFYPTVSWISPQLPIHRWSAMALLAELEDFLRRSGLADAKEAQAAALAAQLALQQKREAVPGGIPRGDPPGDF